MIIAIWVIALLGIALWTLAAWGVHSVLTIDPTRLQDLKPLIHQIPFGETIDQWIPGWRALLAVAVDLTQQALGWVGDAAPWLVWVVWGLGTGTTLIVAAIVSLAVVLIRKGMRASAAARPLGSPQH